MGSGHEIVEEFAPWNVHKWRVFWKKEWIGKGKFNFEKDNLWFFVKKWNEFLVKIAVAPFAGAWIEIELRLTEELRHFVAPFAGAWIEIGYTRDRWITWSVAPFAGAWIEIFQKENYSVFAVVAPFAGAWIEILKHQDLRLLRSGRSLRGSVDWNMTPTASGLILTCRSLRGSVDWNLNESSTLPRTEVAPFAGAWIEIDGKDVNNSEECVAPFAGAWIEITPSLSRNAIQSRSLRGSVDWNHISDTFSQPPVASLPSWERGLKSSGCAKVSRACGVAPFAGAWIEIYRPERYT